MDDQIFNCLSCGYVGTAVGELDECQQCGHEYSPATNGENCPECDCTFYNNTCPECGAAGGDFAEIETMPGWVNKKKYRAEQLELKSSPKGEGFSPTPRTGQ
jgi:rubredoxin